MISSIQLLLLFQLKKGDFTLQTLVLLLLTIIGIILFGYIVFSGISSGREMFEYE
ncbi:MAG: hypothetical protein ACMXYB_01145 [Candidatus Woesearchaeota archaeon]